LFLLCFVIIRGGSRQQRLPLTGMRPARKFTRPGRGRNSAFQWHRSFNSSFGSYRDRYSTVIKDSRGSESRNKTDKYENTTEISSGVMPSFDSDIELASSHVSLSRGFHTHGTLVIEPAGSASSLMSTVLSRWWLCLFMAQVVRTAACTSRKKLRASILSHVCERRRLEWEQSLRQ